MGFETQYSERNLITILKVLQESDESIGSRFISRRLLEKGIELSERAVRYHLLHTDEQGLTQLKGRREGRVITEKGIRELTNAAVKDKIGFAISKIESLSFRTTFDPLYRTGLVPVNVSLFAKERFSEAVQIMKPIFARDLCVSNLVGVAREGQKLGEVTVPTGKVGLATVCSIIINGTLLKAGVPMDSRFGSLLQFHDNQPLRFVEVIRYNGTSIDPSEVFIKAGMTSVIETARTGEGIILANYREIPALCQPTSEKVTDLLKEAGIGGILIVGKTSESVCQMPIEVNRIGMVLKGGLNPVAAVKEAGITSDNRAMSTVIEFNNLVRIDQLV